MAQQPGQPTTGNPKKFNWVSFFMTFIVILGFVLLAWWLFFGFNGRISFKDPDYFANQISENISSNRKKYFRKVAFDRYRSRISIERVDESGDGRKIESYDIQMNPSFIDELYAKGSVTYPGETPVTLKMGDIYAATASSDHVPSKGDDSRVFVAGPPSNVSVLSVILTLLPLFLLIGIGFLLIKRGRGITDSIMAPGRSQARKIVSKKRFVDIAGQDEVKEEVQEVVDFLKHPAKYKAAGARIPKGILLGGPPGTGKTLLAKATAGEANVPFFFISGSNFVEMFAGLGAKRVREMFKETRKAAPAILFIDELDAIGRKRGSSLSGNDEREQTLNQILVELDGMEENAGILVMAATNRVDVLDPALLRPGRFDRTITVSNPDVKERESILKLYAKGKRIANDVVFKNIAKRTPGYSGAQLENIINEAALLSVREQTSVITLAQIDEAIDRVAAGPSKKHRVITPKELEMVAYHEAGHAVVGLKVAAAEKVQKITIIPRGMAGGYTLMTPKEEKYNFSKSELEAKIISYMGGRASEQIIYGHGEVSTGAHNDIERATSIARAMVTQFGMSDLGPIGYERDIGPQYLSPEYRAKEYSDALAEKIDEAIRHLIIAAEEKAIAVIKENIQLLTLIAEELLEKETIIAEEIEYIHRYLKRPPRKISSTKVLGTDKSLDDILKEMDDKETHHKKDPSVEFKVKEELSEKESSDKEEDKDKVKTSDKNDSTKNKDKKSSASQDNSKKIDKKNHKKDPKSK